MTKDFKPRQNAAPRGRGGGLLLGIFIGFLLGLGVAAAIAVYVFKSPVPFVSKVNPPRPGDKATDMGTVGKAGDSKQRFDFYRILPGQEEPVTDKDLRDAARQAPPPAASAAPTPGAPSATTPATSSPGAAPAPGAGPTASAPNAQTAAMPGAQDIYFIQAGAFQNPADADNLKAKIALIGLEASVEPANTPDKGVWYRVRVGPYSRVEEINRVRSQLAQNGIDASLVRIKGDAAKPGN
jgi:cell division septation protein DedD